MASYKDITNILNFAVALKPTSAFPLDARSMFGSYAAAVAAAATAEEPGSTNSIYYIGQTLTVYENGIVADYKIQADKTLKAAGAKVIPDDKTITYGDDGETLSLKSFGKQYFKHHNADTIITGNYTYPDSMPAIAEGSYVKIGEQWYLCGADAWAVTDVAPKTSSYYELVDGWKAGLEPKVYLNSSSTYELAWYEPSSTTVEGLQSIVGSMQTQVDSMSDAIAANKTDIEKKLSDEAARLNGVDEAQNTKIKANTDAIEKLNGDSSIDGSVKNQIATAVAKIMDNPDETMNSIKELVNWVTSHNTEALQMSNNIESNTTAIKAIQTLLGTNLPDTAKATTVIDYIAEVVKAEETRAKGVESDLDTRLKAVESSTTKLGTAAEKDVEFFATAEQGKKADSAVQSVVKGEANGHISVDGTDVEVYAPEVASVTKAGVIKPDGSSITVKEDGTASVEAVDYTKVTGLSTQLEATQTAAVKAAADAADAKYVDQSNIATSTNIAENVEAASDGKVISEKVFLDAMIWKTTM